MTAKGKILLTVLILAALGVGVWRWKDTFFPEKAGQETKNINVAKVAQELDNMAKPAPTAAPAEAKAPGEVTGLLAGDAEPVIVSETAIPAVQGVSGYTASEKNGRPVVKFPINVWPGWAPILMANNGLAPSDESVFFKDHDFYVELSIVDDPVKARDLYASGHSHVLWGTLDMLALFAPELMKDTRTIPNIPMQIDFSAGGDGIVARNGIRSVNDLGVFTAKGKRKVALAQNSPSHYMIMSLLIEAGVEPSKIEFIWTADAPSAAKLYVQDRTIDAFVGWAPDIYIVPEQDPTSRLVVTTSQANRLIADVFAVRNDFATDHPQIVQGLVDGILKGMDMTRQNPTRAAELISAAFNIPVEDCKMMVGDDGGITTGDAHLTNYRENEIFMMRPGTTYSFDVIWRRASKIYNALGYISTEVPPEQVKYTKALVALAPNWTQSTDLSQRVFIPGQSFAKLEADDNVLVVKQAQIRFRPGAFNLDPEYDPEIPKVLEEIGNFTGTFGNALLSVEGNADASLKGTVPADLVRELSQNRAETVRQALLQQYSLPEGQVRAVGNGWDNPLPGMTNPQDKEHCRANRRVEIKIYPLESGD